MIEFKNVSKTFPSQSGDVKAVRDVNLTINKNEIFGVIGHSGAGKSTLVRLINFLETPTSGEVIVNNQIINNLAPKALRSARKQIGIIFQSFNLLQSINVFDNVAFPLKYQGINKNEIRSRVLELLELVGISDKVHAYPSQLSGGQQQRVAIARALATNPDILLCDEATSALDPQSTKNVLALLKELNQKLALTIVIITHEMDVIKSICDKVAIMDEGYVVESGNVIDIFANPKQQITKDFIESTMKSDEIKQMLANNQNFVKEHQVLLNLNFLGSKTNEAIIVKMCKEFDMEASIIYGHTDIIDEEILGNLIISIDKNKIKQAQTYLTNNNIKSEVINNEFDL